MSFLTEFLLPLLVGYAFACVVSEVVARQLNRIWRRP